MRNTRARHLIEAIALDCLLSDAHEESPQGAIRLQFECCHLAGGFTGGNARATFDLRGFVWMVLCSCFFVVCFSGESTNTKPRNHTNQESRKGTKVRLTSQQG